MGCCCFHSQNQKTKQDEAEKCIQYFEKQLRINRLKIQRIKLAFFNLYQNSEIITKNELELGFDQLLKGLSHKVRQNKQFVERKELFIKQFQKQNISIEESREYEFRKFIGVLYMLSGSSEKDKMNSLLQLYDYGNDNQFNSNEIKFMFVQIFDVVWKYSKELCKDIEKGCKTVQNNKLNNSGRKYIVMMMIGICRLMMMIIWKTNQKIRLICGSKLKKMK